MTRKQGVYAMLLGMVGVGIALGVYHVYQDHRDLHAIKTAIVQAQQAAAAKKAALPTPQG